MTVAEQRKWVRFERMKLVLNYARVVGRPGSYFCRWNDYYWIRVTVPEPVE